MRKPPPGEVVNPFSDNFLITWHIWKDYKKQTFGFIYKGVYSEQMTLKKLCELSDGDEEKAVAILEQSIMRQWQGIFPLHIPRKNGTTTKSKQPSSKSWANGSSLENDAADVLKKRNAERGQSDYGSNLKAV